MPRHHKTLMDYLVITITPALIMTLISSLTFFLITVFYEGAFEMRLHFICAMYVMATVLIGRISMEEGTEHAVMYSIPLGLVAMLAVTNLVEIQSESLREIGGIINVGLLAIIWWSAHKLTWDCTWINEDENAGGEGLLGNLGLDDPRHVGTPAGNVNHPAHQQAATEPSPVLVATLYSAASPASCPWPVGHLLLAGRPAPVRFWPVVSAGPRPGNTTVCFPLVVCLCGQWFVPVINDQFPWLTSLLATA